MQGLSDAAQQELVIVRASAGVCIRRSQGAHWTGRGADTTVAGESCYLARILQPANTNLSWAVLQL